MLIITIVIIIAIIVVAVKLSAMGSQIHIPYKMWGTSDSENIYIFGAAETVDQLLDMIIVVGKHYMGYHVIDGCG